MYFKGSIFNLYYKIMFDYGMYAFLSGKYIEDKLVKKNLKKHKETCLKNKQKRKKRNKKK